MIKLFFHSCAQSSLGEDVIERDFETKGILVDFVFKTIGEDIMPDSVWLVMPEFTNYDNDENPCFFVSADRNQIVRFILTDLGRYYLSKVSIFECEDYKAAFRLASDVSESSFKHTILNQSIHD